MPAKDVSQYDRDYVYLESDALSFFWWTHLFYMVQLLIFSLDIRLHMLDSGDKGIFISPITQLILIVFIVVWTAIVIGHYREKRSRFDYKMRLKDAYNQYGELAGIIEVEFLRILDKGGEDNNE